ncbi:hypothetical protein E5676_scaffold306G002860 [Cucumis melo var. makuwa]|uniref:Uncharacterized protein n=1 Tax=Cucumis melo var. makuwa TaxID=1194695 RepID=A0A5A7TF31_CUCMM|nr:hypothetical protein E6C27_scaffold67G004980 [Cucumis melo var. makuwa]TYK17980.1 hypothetical protein E5676_scaffold306G002860 [Cucumis melo var. makuwa]
MKRHQIELLREEDTQWSWNLECQATFNSLKQVMGEGPSLGVVDATKPPEVEVEQFNCRSAQTDSLIKRSPFEIKDSGHFVLPTINDDRYVGNNPQVHRVEDDGNRWLTSLECA